MTPRSERPSTTKRPDAIPAPAAVPVSGRERRVVGVSWRLLIACAPFWPRLPAVTVAGAIARGVEDGGLPEPDVCALPLPGANGEDREHVRRVLHELDFDERMRHARAVIVAVERLEERTLAGSVTFEIATRARQGGVPAYAVTAENALDSFDARILDLQLILQARSRATLTAVGRELAGIV
ncbi:MAG: glycerate kinase [Solirubrobacterales bacterium]|nr:glycerate kinase [Solirubrobacterales bacterium]